MGISLREALAFTLFLSWLVLVLRQPRTRPRSLKSTTTYTFSARAPIQQGKTTYLKFTAPSPPQQNPDCVPTILRTLDTSSMFESTPSLPRVTSPSIMEELSDIDKPEKHETILRSAVVKTKSRSPVLRIEPVIQAQKPPVAATLNRRLTRSSSRVYGIPPAMEAGPSSTPSKSHQLPKYVRQKKPYTAWHNSSGDEPLHAPPVFRNQQDICDGDVFRHLTADSCQLWLWDKAGAYWRTVPLGYVRADGRCLSLTDKKKEPSWVGTSWSRKRISALKHQTQLE